MANNSAKLALVHNWSLGENGWNVGMDNNIKKIDGLIQLSVESATVASPPTSPVLGSLFIIPANATGSWASNTNKITHYYNGVWNIYQPEEGWQAWVKDVDTRVNFDGSNWSDPLASLKSNVAALQIQVNNQATTISDLSTSLQNLSIRVKALEDKAGV